MKKLVQIFIIVVILTGCSNSSTERDRQSYMEPECTAYDQVSGVPYDHETINGEISFRGSTKFIIWDRNVHCPNEPNYDFRTEATSVRNPLKGDRCLHCKKTWYVHQKK